MSGSVEEEAGLLVCDLIEVSGLICEPFCGWSCFLAFGARDSITHMFETEFKLER